MVWNGNHIPVLATMLIIIADEWHHVAVAWEGRTFFLTAAPSRKYVSRLARRDARHDHVDRISQTEQANATSTNCVSASPRVGQDWPQPSGSPWSAGRGDGTIGWPHASITIDGLPHGPRSGTIRRDITLSILPDSVTYVSRPGSRVINPTQWVSF
jgi:hypothetical protein